MALRVLGTTLTSTYLVCLRASLADAHRFEGTGKLTGRLGLMQASERNEPITTGATAA